MFDSFLFSTILTAARKVTAAGKLVAVLVAKTQIVVGHPTLFRRITILFPVRGETGTGCDTAATQQSIAAQLRDCEGSASSRTDYCDSPKNHHFRIYSRYHPNPVP